MATYSTFRLGQVIRQAKHAFVARRTARELAIFQLGRLRRDEARIRAVLGRELAGLDVFELGPGQHCVRSGYFGRKNRVTGIDLDEIVLGVDPRGLVRAARANGLGRLLKTLARKALGFDRAVTKAWCEALGVPELPRPRLVRADVCGALPFRPSSADLVVSWSVFEHLPDPARALDNIVDLLRPGGAFCLGVHLFTSNTGHHDIRAFTGAARELPLWAHLRASTFRLVEPSAVLNEWRLDDWRQLLRAKAPGFVEYREAYGEERLRQGLTPALRAELAKYSEEELLTTDVFFLWRKPEPSVQSPRSAKEVAATLPRVTASQAQEVVVALPPSAVVPR